MLAEGDALADVRQAKKAMLKTIHKILLIHLGTPPKEFTWQYTDTGKAYHEVPLGFGRIVVSEIKAPHLLVVLV